MSLPEFFSFVQLGVFSAEGGYDTIPLIQNQMAALVNADAQNETNPNGEAAA